MRVVTQVEITLCAAATSGEAADREQHEPNEVRERKLEARGVAVKRNNAGMKHAGEVHASDSLVIVKERLKDHCGTHLIIKFTGTPRAPFP